MAAGSRDARGLWVLPLAWASLTPWDLGTPLPHGESAGMTPINHPFVRAHGAGWSHGAGYEWK